MLRTRRVAVKTVRAIRFSAAGQTKQISLLHPRTAILSLARSDLSRTCDGALVVVDRRRYRGFSSSAQPESKQQEDSAQSAEAAPQPPLVFDTIYTGPFEAAVRKVKRFSLSSLVATCVGSPILFFFGNQTVSMSGRAGISIVGTCAFSTFDDVM